MTVSLSIVTDATIEQVVTLLIISSKLIEISFIDNDYERKDVSVPKTRSVINFHCDVCDFSSVLELKYNRNRLCIKADLISGEIGKAIEDNSFEIIYVKFECERRIVSFGIIEIGKEVHAYYSGSLVLRFYLNRTSVIGPGLDMMH